MKQGESSTPPLGVPSGICRFPESVPEDPGKVTFSWMWGMCIAFSGVLSKRSGHRGELAKQGWDEFGHRRVDVYGSLNHRVRRISVNVTTLFMTTPDEPNAAANYNPSDENDCHPSPDMLARMSS